MVLLVLLMLTEFASVENDEGESREKAMATTERKRRLLLTDRVARKKKTKTNKKKTKNNSQRAQHCGPAVKITLAECNARATLCANQGRTQVRWYGTSLTPGGGDAGCQVGFHQTRAVVKVCLFERCMVHCTDGFN